MEKVRIKKKRKVSVPENISMSKITIALLLKEVYKTLLLPIILNHTKFHFTCISLMQAVISVFLAAGFSVILGWIKSGVDGNQEGWTPLDNI